MRLKTVFLSSCVSIATVVFGVPARAALAHECVSAKPTAQSYTWDFKTEASTIFEDLQAEARQARNHADTLQSFARNPGLSWEAHSNQLAALKAEVNDMGAKLCRMETIRRVVAPWQQAEIDRIAKTVRLMADNTEDAMQFLNGHQGDLWLATYRKYTDNLYNEASMLTQSTQTAVEYAKLSKEYRSLAHKLS